MSEGEIHDLLRKLNSPELDAFSEEERELLVRLVELHQLKKFLG